MFGRALLCVIGFVVAVVPAGCGGGSKAPDPKAEQARWAHDVDAACTRTGSAIAQRGHPATADAVPRVIAGAADDARDGVREVASVRRPAQLTRPAASFLAEAHRVEGKLAAMSRAARSDDHRTLAGAVAGMWTELKLLRDAAKQAGLDDCARLEGADRALGAVDALFLSRQLAGIEHRIGERLERAEAHPPITLPEAVRYFHHVGNIVFRWEDYITYLAAPKALDKPVIRYRRSVDTLQTLCRATAAKLADTSTIAPGQAAAIDHRFRRAGKRAELAYRQLQRAVRRMAAPLLPDPPGAGAAPGEPQQS